MHSLTTMKVTDLAGYHEISWSGIRPGENLLVGRNGAGKSTLLEAIVVGLKYVHGQRTGDLLTGSNEGTRIHLEFSDGSVRSMSLGDIHASQTPDSSRRVENVLYVHEGRRPKSRFGKGGRSRLLQHPTKRYEYVLAELQALLRGSVKEREWAESLLSITEELLHSGHPSEWTWARSVLPRGGPNARRPVSCGQYDVLSLLLDVVRTAEAVAANDTTAFVILDNPDAFFHPALQQEMIAWIRRRLPEAQLFMASHSLKLLARADPSSVFWLSRDLASPDHCVTVQPVRDLAPDTRSVFFELYGDDTSSAVLKLTLGLESSEYLAFLCACALPCHSAARVNPVEDDVQIRAVLEELRHFEGQWTLVDIGAGAGDLLIGAERLGIANPVWVYIAVEANPSDALVQRLAESRRAGRIAPSSRIVTRMDEIPSPCDAVVFVNSCHALGLDQLAAWLAGALHALRPSPQSRCVIHEVEILQHGERGYVMWTPDDYRSAFATVPGVQVEERMINRTIGVPVQTTVLTRDSADALASDLEARLRDAFVELLLPKLRALQTRLESLQAQAQPPTLREALRQRERAFVSEQCTTVLGLALSHGLITLPASQHLPGV